MASSVQELIYRTNPVMAGDGNDNGPDHTLLEIEIDSLSVQSVSTKLDTAFVSMQSSKPERRGD